jgi:predicted Fe-Mo cluster-binding NifX family protein
MADVQDQVVETTEVTEEQQPTTHEQTTETGYSFTQEQVDEVVAKRLAREREAFAKKLGVDKYEAVDSFLEQYENTVKEREEIAQQSDYYVEALFDRELRLTALSHGVNPEHLERTVKLAIAELEQVPEDEDLDLAHAISIVLDDFPMLKGGEQPVRKIGAETAKEGSNRTEIDRYLDKYKNSKYFNK